MKNDIFLSFSDLQHQKFMKILITAEMSSSSLWVRGPSQVSTKQKMPNTTKIDVINRRETNKCREI